ncbi:MAG: NAD-binding protein, partial [Gemmatimonadota bacterium]|nr:NAD-binding protein [Gemmatimonadota bacterium]
MTRWLVWGAGAIGGTMAAYLARAGHDVTVVDAVEEHVAAIDEMGIRITGPIATFDVRVPAFTPEAVRG